MTLLLLHLAGRRCRARLTRRCILGRGRHAYHVDRRGDVFWLDEWTRERGRT